MCSGVCLQLLLGACSREEAKSCQKGKVFSAGGGNLAPAQKGSCRLGSLQKRGCSTSKEAGLFLFSPSKMFVMSQLNISLLVLLFMRQDAEVIVEVLGMAVSGGEQGQLGSLPVLWLGMLIQSGNAGNNENSRVFLH